VYPEAKALYPANTGTQEPVRSTPRVCAWGRGETGSVFQGARKIPPRVAASRLLFADPGERVHLNTAGAETRFLRFGPLLKEKRFMLMVLSPAKTLDYETPPVISRYSQPEFLDHSQILMAQLRDLTPAQLAELMHLSDKLAGLNAARFGSWQPEFSPANAKQALLAFKGDVYTGLDAESFSEDDFTFAQQHLRMLSGLYGLLRPLDLMRPYRLEMGTKLNNVRGKDLYAFWGDHISQWLNQALQKQGDDVLLNLASQEYFSAVRPKVLNARIIDTEFKDLKNGQYKIISFYAKKARGLMARWVIQERLTDPQGLKDFQQQGYRYSAKDSSSDKLVFLRERDQP
jgi:cytoplasmic iron level regulating protein YaaA (DUF328/UPF0246 family)